jgi:hypothetical protein
MSRTVYPQRRKCATCGSMFTFVVPIRRLYCSQACVPQDVVEHMASLEVPIEGYDPSLDKDSVGSAPRCCWKWQRVAGVKQGRAWKKKFFTRREPESLVARDPSLRVYRCVFCDYYHCGHLADEAVEADQESLSAGA